MATGTVVIAVTPGYAMIGVAAPIIVVPGRLLQGFSAGVELGGVSVYLAEIATPGTKGCGFRRSRPPSVRFRGSRR
jgi:MHS family citrate/tricarballylate:H+ symporter-like MFS transporter